MRWNGYPDSLVSWSISSVPVSIPETVFPYIRHQRSARTVKETIVEYTKRLAQALHVIGLINIQFIVDE